MALLTAKQDPQTAFADLDTSQTGLDYALASYTRVNSSTARITLKSKTASNNDWILTINGSSLPSSAGQSLAFFSSSIGKVSLARKNLPSSTLFSWDGQGATIKGSEIYSALQSSNSDAFISLFLKGSDTLEADYQNVDISPLAQLENITMQASARTIIGNSANNLITGNSAANLIDSGTGSDTIIGGDGNDTLRGGDGNDLLNGGAGTDIMEGGQGHDLYLIASSADHTGAEINDQGGVKDELRFASTTAGQTLTVYAGDIGLESVVIGTGATNAAATTTATIALNVKASAAPNGLEIIGNNGVNTINGTPFADIIQGNSGNDSLIGGQGADTINGGLGKDTLTGGLGEDFFKFDSVLNASTNVDRITDFSIVQSDRIQLENTGTGLFTGISTTGTLASTAFRVGTSFTSTLQRIRYDSGTGNLLYDSDGSGAAASILFATLNTGLALTNSQFLVT